MAPLAEDGDLVRQVLGGEVAAYDVLARRWTRRVVALCHAKAGRPIADDLAQEALLRGFRALGSLQQPDRFGPWLLGIARRVCLDWLKAKARTQVTFGTLSPLGDPEEALGLAGGPSGSDLVERREEVERLMAEVERLAEPLRETLLLYYYEDVTYQELADSLGVSAATVNARLTKARALLRERLASRER